MRKFSFIHGIRTLWMSAFVIFLLTACSDKDDVSAAASAVLRYDVVDSQTTRNQLLLSGENMTFEAQIVSGAEWLSFSSSVPGDQTVSGAVTPVVFLYLSKNTTPEDRTAVIRVSFSNGENFSLSLLQQRYSSSDPYDKAWAEQPQYVADMSFVYKTYYTTLSDSKYVRSYSICYDLDKKVAHWVAYPLHRVYTVPSVQRTDAWAYDPNVQMPVIPESDQQYIVQSYNTGYARGHQCPSADRYSTVDTNKQTFYATNMMPQNSDFNGGIWGTLENKIRENIVGDTLYVVTGTFFADARTTTDRRGNRIGLPSNCWKVLLRTRKGNTGKRIQDCTPDELQGIGFWFANDNSNAGALSGYARPIAEIERLTGFTFFRNLPQSAAASVKAQNNPSVWNIR